MDWDLLWNDVGSRYCSCYHTHAIPIDVPPPLEMPILSDLRCQYFLKNKTGISSVIVLQISLNPVHFSNIKDMSSLCPVVSLAVWAAVGHFLRLRWSYVKQMRGTHKTDDIHFLQHPTGLLPWKHQSEGWAWVSVITNVHLRPSITCLACIATYLLLWFHFSICWAARKVTKCQAKHT